MFKQVIVIRNDLKLGKGKLAVEVAHGSLEAYKKADPKIKAEWESSGSKKVVVKVDDLKQLLEIYEKVKKLRLPSALIKDAGRTQVKPGTITSLAIGPCRSDHVDKITKDLKLL